MSASDNLGQQFSTWYHGTSMERAKSIQKSGLRADAYGMTHGEVNNPTLTTDKRAARVWIPHFVQGAVVEVHVPDDKKNEYLAQSTNNSRAGLNKPLPASWIHNVEDVGSKRRDWE